MYEVRSISHSSGESLPEGSDNRDTLNLSLMYDRFIDILDSWVDQGIEPPPNRSDWAKLGDVDGDEVIDYPAISFPEVACPLGIWAPHSMGSGSTFFIPFTGDSQMEPMDRNQVFVDMNRNGIRDLWENPTQAWRRLGLLQSDETLTLEKYGACVYDSAQQLRREGLFSQRIGRWYTENVKEVNLNSEPTERSAGGFETE